MTIPRLLRKIAGLAYPLGLGCALAACSGSEAPPENTGGSAGAGGSSAGGSSAGSNHGGSGAITGSDEVIGSFGIGLEAAKMSVDVSGKVSDSALTLATVWETTLEEGDCIVEEPSTPFCDPGCGADICSEEGTCVPYPVGHSVGDVTLSGLRQQTGATELLLKEVNAGYQPPANTLFDFPPFAEGDEVKIHAAGMDYPGFDLLAHGVPPLVLTSTDFALTDNKPLELTWEAAADPKASLVHLKLDLSHHGGIRGRVQCDTDDDGELTISGAMMTFIIGLGVSGFPTVELTRTSSDIASIPQGRVRLNVSAFVSQLVTVGDLISCNATSCAGNDDPGCLPCPDDMTCRTDLVCE